MGEQGRPNLKAAVKRGQNCYCRSGWGDGPCAEETEPGVSHSVDISRVSLNYSVAA